jgi:hypothetical protein
MKMVDRLRKLSRPSPQSLWLIAALALFCLYFSRVWLAGNDDFTAYYNAGQRALHGISPYKTEATPFRYLPSISFLFIPFTFFDFHTARVIFFLLNFSAVIALYRSFRKKLGDLPTFLIALLFIRFHNHDFGNSQVNPILLILFFYWWENRKNKLHHATLAFAVFGSFKLLPFVLGLPLLVRGRWREIGLIATWTLLLNFLPIFFFENHIHVFANWFEEARKIGDPAMMSNIQSLQSALWWNLEGHLSEGVFSVLSRVIQVVLLGTALLLAPKKNTEDWMIASTLALTTIFSPLAWKHNYLQFIPLVYLWLREDSAFREKRTQVLYGLAVIGFILLPWSLGLWDRVGADRLYFMPWTGALIVLLGPYLARTTAR